MKGNLIYTSPWIFPICSIPIKDGAIVMDAEQIIMVGRREEVIRDYPGCKIVELDGIIMPPLINCHIHLELSYIKNQERPAAGSTIVDWIDSLLRKRQELENDDIVAQSIHDTVKDQYNSGVVLMADVGNVSRKLFSFAKKNPEILPILEFLGPTKKRTELAIDSFSLFDKTQYISPHAPYSTSAHLITVLKKRADALSHVFSIHVGESLDEVEFICRRSGVFQKFLEKKESWEPNMFGDGNYLGAVDYLNKLGVLDDRTLCVHCVHIKDEEISLLAQKDVKVCLCPGSNEFLDVGCAPLEEMLRCNILPAIGTDSSASNESLDMWREMQILRRNNPTVNAEIILKMATLGGALALHKSEDYGTLSPGKKPLLLEIMLGDSAQSKKENILDILTLGGRPQKINWITSSEN